MTHNTPIANSLIVVTLAIATAITPAGVLAENSHHSPHTASDEGMLAEVLYDPTTVGSTYQNIDISLIAQSPTDGDFKDIALSLAGRQVELEQQFDRAIQRNFRELLS